MAFRSRLAAFLAAAATWSGGAMAQPPGTLTIAGVARPVRSATFGIHVKTEAWDPEGRVGLYDPARAETCYGIDIEVDERSGEDGAPAPQVGSIPVARANGGRHPSLEQLATLAVRELDDGYDCDEWDAWFGNDAPGLCGNRITFQGWEGNALRVRWEAHYDDRGRERPFLYEGLVEFTGIVLAVKQPEEADVFLARAWGGQPVETLERHALGWRDLDPKFAPDRRFWYSVVYGRKGEPLAGRYRLGAPTREAATAQAEADRARYAEARKQREAASSPPPTPAPPLQPGPARRLSDARGRFSLEAPGDWAVVPPEADPVMARLGGISLRRGAGPGEESLKAVAVEMLIADDLAEYVDTSVGAYRSIWQIEERGDVTLAGARGVRLVLLQTIGPATTRLLKYFLALPEKQVLVMTLAAPPGGFAARLASYEAVADSIEIAR
ncbi:MAG: hypothetical protein ABW221_25160 [Vicinamibacteria bacterium]